MDEQSSVKKTYEEKKEAKEQVRQARQSAQNKKHKAGGMVRTLIIILILGGLVFLFIRAVQKELPQGEDTGQFFENQGRDHVGTNEEHEEYNSNPPSSGPHFDSPVPVGYYRDAVLDGNVIHNLEHGDVWIAYHPRLLDNEDAISVLREFENDGKVIITPREANDFDISLVAWEWVDSFNIEDDVVLEKRIADFVKRHRNRGPERVNQPRN